MTNKAKTEKLSITLPGELVARIRSSVPRGEVSSFLAEAADFYLAWRRQREGLEKGFGAWKPENHPELKTPEDTARFVRKLRSARSNVDGRIEAVAD